MRLNPRQLGEHLQRKKLANLYLIAGNEPFQMRECTDVLRNSVHNQGFAERLTFTVETGFDWQPLEQAIHSLSLFAQKRLIELHLGDKNPDKVGSAMLTTYATHPPPDTILLVTKNKLDSKSKWLTTLEKNGIIVQIRSLDAQQLVAWITQQTVKQGLQLSPEAIQILAERSEGHLLACAQEIEKLGLLYGTGTISAEQVLEAVADSARFELFNWVDTVLAGDAQRVIRQLYQLKAEGYAIVLVTWALAKEIRLLCQLSHAVEKGHSQEQAFKTYRIWQNRTNIINRALNRHPNFHWHQFLQQAIKIDKMAKGMAVGSVWDALLQLSLQIAHPQFIAIFDQGILGFKKGIYEKG